MSFINNKLQVSESRKCTGTVITVFGFNAEDLVHFIPSLCGGYFEAIQIANQWIEKYNDELTHNTAGPDRKYRGITLKMFHVKRDGASK